MRQGFPSKAVTTCTAPRCGREPAVRRLKKYVPALVAGILGAIIAITGLVALVGDWRGQTGFTIAAATLSAWSIAFISYPIVGRKTRRQIQSERLRLVEALENMEQGLKVYDASARLITCNRRYIDMFGLSTDVVKPGVHFCDVMQHRKDRGTFDGDVRQFCSAVIQGVTEGRITKKVMELSDGRAIRIVNTPLAQGGWIATLEDVTERRDLEQECDRNQTLLREIIDHIPWQITVKDARTRRYLLVNRVAEEELGGSRESIVGKTAFDIFAEPIAEMITREDEGLLRSPDKIALNSRVWNMATIGDRYVTSRRISVPDKTGEPCYIINVVEDVTERRNAEEKIAHMAHYDALTDLPNRVLLRERIEREFEKNDGGEKFAVLYIDIDEFKGINDSLGHHVGDELLKAIANRIRSCLEQDDMIARLGGDEFAVIRTKVDDAAELLAFVIHIQETIRQPYYCLGHQLSTDASIGIALAPQDGTDLDQLLKNADLAMYNAKSAGRRTYRFFEPAMDASARARLALEQDLRRAVADAGFELHYQPFVDLRTGEVSGFEALLRWHHPERGVISSDEFIPVAEDTGLIVELGDWVLRTACMEATNWPDRVRLAVNVSPVQFKSETLALKIASALAASGLNPRRLELEITEAVLIRDDEAALSALHQLRSLGVRIALDDFGTGYSSLSYLKRFPFEKIKIDRCFIADIAEAGVAKAIVQAVVNIASASNMITVAEGVETERQREILHALGCAEMQGYLLSPPMSAEEATKLFNINVELASAS